MPPLPADFETLVAPHRQGLHRYGHRVLGSAADTDDALQGTLLDAWRGLVGFEGSGTARASRRGCSPRRAASSPPRRASLEVDFLQADSSWAAARRTHVLDFVRRRFGSLSESMNGREHVAGAFAAADILVPTVLHVVRHTDLVAGWPVLEAYQARCGARPAFQRALQGQKSAFARFDAVG